MLGLFVGSIHNGELHDSPASAVVREIDRGFPGSQICEFFEQQPFTDEPDLATLREWSSFQWSLEQQWRTYLGRRSLLRDMAGGVGRRVWQIRIAQQEKFRNRAWHIRQVESAVSNKHQQAWQAFAASDLDAGLVLESDATWIPGCASRLQMILEHFGRDKFQYVNLAGGLSPRRLSIAHVRPGANTAIAGDFVRYAPPVTNTSCAYLISRSTAQLLLDGCRSHPERASLGVDWLINASFLEAWKRGIEIECWHATPPMLTHGSTSGVTESWHPAR